MSRFAIHCLRILLFFAFLGTVVGIVWRQDHGLMVFLTLLSAWLVVHLWQISQLITWLERPKPSTVPNGIGIWQQIFNTLLQQSKSRKRRKQKIAQTLQRLYKAFEVMPDGVLILSQDGRIEWMNSVAREHFLLKEEDVGGILANLVRQPVFHQFMSNQASSDEIKLSLPLPKGLTRSVILKRTEFDKDLLLLVSQDISRIDQLNQTRTDFIANVSHELRTPLTVINGFVETMQDYPQLPLEKREQFLSLMKKDSDRMLALLDDLLTLSRLENTKDGQLQPINLSAMVGQLTQEGVILSNGKQTFTTEVAPDIWVKGMQLDLYNALSNLVFNAVRYNHEGGHIKIELRVNPDHTTTFSVEDNGPGIESEHIPRLTERFYRVDTGRSRAQGGTGLGLAITKHALAEHGSQLDVQSQVGQGSTFSATFETIQAPHRVRLVGHQEEAEANV